LEKFFFTAFWNGSIIMAQRNFKFAKPGYRYEFPRDHAAHPDFKTEWWHYIGHLKTKDGHPFGFQVTFFRHSLSDEEWKDKPQLKTDTLYFAHFAVTDEKRKAFTYREKFIRGGTPKSSSAEANFYRTWIADWVVEGLGRYHHIQTVTDSLSLNLVFLPKKSPVIHGIDGVKWKADGEGHATHYYSISRAEVEGILTIYGQPVEVVGISWFDREFGTSQLGPQQVGWDWFSVQLNNNEELMIYLLRNGDGTTDHNSSGTYIDSDGASEHLTLNDLSVQVCSKWKSKRSGAEYPASWILSVPRRQLRLEVIPTVENQELHTEESTRITYWEGSVKIAGTLRGKKVTGRGYTELTGYTKSLGINLAEVSAFFSRKRREK